MRAAASDDVQKLQDENAALRKRLAELEGQAAAQKAATTTTQTTTTTTATPGTLATDEGVQTMSKFSVNSDKDTGYLKTNAATATRIGMEVQRTPLAIEIKSAEFLADTNTNSLMDILRYTAAGSGDNTFAMARPANSSTPVGIFTMRGFQINTIMRNGVQRYTAFNLESIERVEVVKGPAALFFGSGEPGGVINFITKLPVFARIPTTISWITGSDHKHKWVIDNNSFFSQKAAMRIIATAEDSGGGRRFEYNKNTSGVASATLVPFESGKLRITAEAEYTLQQFNQNRGNDWIYPTGWFNAYNTSINNITDPNLMTLEAGAIAQGVNLGGAPGSAAAAAAMTARYLPVGADATYGNDLRAGNNNQKLATYTSDLQGAFYLNAAGNRIQDKGFNWDSRGAFDRDTVNTVDLTVEFSPFDWLDGRYVVTNDNNRFDDNEGITQPLGDGQHFNVFSGLGLGPTLLASAGYYKHQVEHDFDLIFKKDFWGLKNKLLVGGFFREFLQQYNANSGGAFSPFYGLIPGASNAIANPGGAFTGGILNATNVGVNQVIRDRYGNIKTVQQIFTNWDPGFEIQPDIHPLLVIDRTAIDGYYQQEQAGYINYQGQAFNDRLTILAGVRREEHRDEGQNLTSNFPYYSPPATAYYDTTTYPGNQYGYDPGYAGDRDGEHSRIAGTAWMAGLSYQVLKDVNVYVSTSKIYNRNGAANAGGYSTLNVPLWVAAAQAYLGSLPGGLAAHPFVYNGVTINTTADMTTALHAEGADVLIPPETGRNAEIGIKTSLWDDKLVGTLSFFSMFRVNRRADDGVHVAAEPLDGANNYVFFGPPGYVNPTGQNFIGGRLLRWRLVGQKDVVNGSDFEVTWTPIRNFQMVVNGAWLWDAYTDNNPLTPKPGSAAFNLLNPAIPAQAAAIQNDIIYYAARLENVPEYRLNSFSKYTITDGMFHGLSLALGTRYSSKMVISRSVAWNPMTNGFQAGNYFVMDANVSYPWEVFGYKITSTASVQNLADKLYFEGGTVASPGRQLFITNKLSF